MLTFQLHIPILLLITVTAVDPSNNPQIRSEDVNLLFTPGLNGMISFKAPLTSIQFNDQTFSSIISQMVNRSRRVFNSRQRTMNNRLNTSLHSNVDAVKEEVSGLNLLLEQIQRDLEKDECESNPCLNGGKCIDGYKKFHCDCTFAWKGSTCVEDVDECAAFNGTDQGCHNGAHCYNTPGSFKCHCQPHNFGPLCIATVDNCNASSNTDICGHGTCLSQIPSIHEGAHFKCICDHGWKNNGTNTPCTVDIDECTTGSPCDQGARCVNTPGSFNCGPCPTGYEGNGFQCTDINECLVRNGGCSQSPFVECLNTPGSSFCKQCPLGFTGDGKFCTMSSACANSNCDPLAQCIETPGVNRGWTCRCPTGFFGNGIGPGGCQQDSMSINPCISDPCIHGVCNYFPGNPTYTCNCSENYYGQNCEYLTHSCRSAPCFNNGSCNSLPNGLYICDCTPGFTGDRCETPQNPCGGSLEGHSGYLTYPVDTVHYEHQLTCEWEIRSNDYDKIISLNFLNFDLEDSDNCMYDSLSIYDADNSRGSNFGKFCGNTLNGAIKNSTGHVLTLLFTTDHSENATGFRIHWTTEEPTCGEMITEADHGTITSPGYPNRYPDNRDCRWILNGKPGTTFTFHISDLQLEQHRNCVHDFIEVRDGLLEHSTVIKKICYSDDTAPIKTSGPAAQIYFHSDYSESGNGFSISYSSISNTLCGGTFTQESGSIQSPGFPQGYENSLDCTWLISPPHKQLTLTFESFDLEGGRVCPHDYVVVIKGKDENGLLAGEYCGSTIPPVLQIDGIDHSSIFIKFHTDEDTTYGGFKASWVTVCGGVHNEMVGNILSPNFPSKYPPNQNCTYFIQAAPSSNVILAIRMIDLQEKVYQECRDYLKIRSYSQVVHTYCGSETKDTFHFQGQISIEFFSDAEVEGNGFDIHYIISNNTQRITETDEEIEDSGMDECGGTLTLDHGVINSPGNLESYPDNLDCYWFIELAQTKIIKLLFLHINIEADSSCSYDFIEVFDDREQIKSLGKFCGNVNPNYILSSGRYLTIHFHTDHSESEEGFRIAYTAINLSYNCGGRLRNNEGVITSPNYPDDYTHTTCEWIITADPSNIINLHIKSFVLESSSNCFYDFLEIRNGAYSTSPLLGKFCGSVNPGNFTSFGNSMYLKFVADDDEYHKGFELTYESTTKGCGGTLTSHLATFTSPNYPNAPFTMGECLWKIVVSKGSRVKLHFTVFDIFNSDRCLRTYVQITEGENQAFMEKMCGNNFKVVHESNDNEMRIKYMYRDQSINKGFSAFYLTDCKGNLTERQGSIESPNFPSTFPSNLNCAWVIKPPSAKTITINVEHFQMNAQDDCKDYIEILSADDVRLEKICNNSFIQHEFESDVVKVKFISSDVSYHRILRDSFRLHYSSSGCGELIQENVGSITSPNYPNNYEKNLKCVWEIRVDIHLKINLTIHDINLEESPQCNYDSVTIYDGVYAQSRVLTKACNSISKEMSVTSIGHILTIELITDHADTGKGFNMTWKAIDNDCIKSYSLDTAFLQSPNYPNLYNDSLDCFWYIQVTEGFRVKLTISDFEFEEHCEYDNLTIYSDISMQQTLKLICGTVTDLPLILHSHGNIMVLNMRTDGSEPYKGFKASYETECGSTIKISNDELGTLSSPNYPLDYSHIQNCTWVLKNEDLGEKVSLDFVSFSLESSSNCVHDYVEIFNGASTNAPSIGKYCGKVPPPAITSMGYALTIRFVSDESHTSIGFKVIYTRSSSVCGMKYNLESGSINSPNFPNAYPRQIQCSWNITGSAGNNIEITFLFFDMEKGAEDCKQHDYLLLTDDNPESHPEWLCDMETSYSKMYQTSWLLLTFQSDNHENNHEYTGFSLRYKIGYGGHLPNWEAGTLESPNYPHLYAPDQDILWHLMPPNSQTLRFIFTFMDLEMPDNNECWDYIEITYSTQAHKFCGSEIPAPFITTSTPVNIRFFSDSSYEYNGFQLTWKADEVLQKTENITFAEDGCGGNIVLGETKNVTITSPNFPNHYAINLRCKWHITSLSGFVQFEILFIDIEESETCYYDSLNIVDVNGVTAEMSVCGDNHTVVTRKTVVHGSQAQVQFNTDDQDEFVGFKLVVSTTCDRSFEQNAGLIRSPNLNGNYAPGLNCTYYITIEEGQVINLSFKMFDVPCNDSIEIFEGGNTLITKTMLCKNHIYKPIDALISSSNQLVIRFVSNSDSIVGRGFEALYMPVSSGCGNNFQLTEDIQKYTIQSPEYPYRYPSSSDCVWVVTTENNTSIAATFLDGFHISNLDDSSCASEKLIVRDGSTSDSPLMGVFCGRVKPNPITSSGGAIFFRFITTEGLTNTPSSNNGFKVELTYGVCGGKSFLRQGSITSPNYPDNYPPNTHCQWTIEVPYNHYATMSFESLNINDCNDKLIVRDFNGTGPIIDTICNVPKQISTAGNVFVIQFYSDNKLQSNGFKLNFLSSSEECGGDHVSLTGTIESPNYPHITHRRRFCKWTISAPEGKLISIKIDVLNLSQDLYSLCRNNKLKIINGRFKDSPTLFDNCILPASILKSSYNFVQIEYSVNQSVTGSSFKLTYNTVEDNYCSLWHNQSQRIISVPEYMNTYNTECQFQIHYPSHSNSKTTYLTSTPFNKLNTACETFIEILEYPSNRKIGRFCGHTPLPTMGLASASSALKLRFRNGREDVEKVNISYNFSECGGIIREEGSIRSLSDTIENCMWQITAPEHHIIQLTISGTSAENIDCEKVFLEIKNGLYHDSPVILKTCKINSTSVYLTQSNSARVGFFSKPSAFGSLKLNIHVQFTSQGCGGWRHGKEGSIAFVQQDLQNNLQCQWHIRVPTGYHILAHFQDNFSIGESRSSSCFNMIEVSSPFWNKTKYCGRQLPGPIEVPTNQMDVKMLLLHPLDSQKFKLNFKAVCGSNYSAYEGKVTTPNYPSFYHDNRTTCTSYINLSTIQNISIYIRNSNRRNNHFGRDIGIYHAATRNRGLHHSQYYTYHEDYCPGGYVEIGSLSNANQRKKECHHSMFSSFIMQTPVYVKFVPKSETSEQTPLALEYNVIDCGSTFTENYGVISIPHNFGFRQAYICKWFINITDERKIIRFRFRTRVTLQCNRYKLSFYENINNAEVRFMNLCRDNRETLFYSSTNRVQVEYNKLSPTISYHTFRFEYQSVFKCGGIIEREQHIEAFHSVAGSNAFYEPNLNCEWKISYPPNKSVFVHWSTISFPHSTDRCGDYIEIYDNVFQRHPIIKICDNMTNFNFRSVSNHLRILFVSDDSDESTAMQAYVRVAPRECGGFYNISSNQTKSLSTPIKETLVSNSIRCQWRISAEVNERIQIDFLSFHFSDVCSNSYLQITSREDSEEKFKYCGSVLPNRYVSGSNEIIITYYALSEFANKGMDFNLTYKISSCDKVYKSSGGLIESDTNFHISGDKECEHTIQAASGYGITIMLPYLRIGITCPSYIEVIYTVNSQVYTNQSCSSYESFEIPTNLVKVRHVSKFNQLMIGFSLTYTSYPMADRCGGVINAKSGYIFSPSYPQHNTKQYNCTWTLFLKPKHLITINVISIYTREDKDCSESKSTLIIGRPGEMQCYSRRVRILPQIYSGADLGNVTINYVSTNSDENVLFNLRFKSIHEDPLDVIHDPETYWNN